MKIKPFLLILFQCLPGVYSAYSQDIRYSDQQVLIRRSDDLQLAASIGGHHHLLNFSMGDKPGLYIFNARLELLKAVTLPFSFPHRAEYSIIQMDQYYYLYIHSMDPSVYHLWKIDGEGKAEDMSAPFQKILFQHAPYIDFGFQLTIIDKSFAMIYQSSLPATQKNVFSLIKMDDQLHPTDTSRVMYDFDSEIEVLKQVSLVNGRYLMVLKTAERSSSLELMKTDLATGYTLSDKFSGSGYYFSQPSFSCSQPGAGITVASTLVQPIASLPRNEFVFTVRLNDSLETTVPIAIFKTQFRSNTGTDFLMAESAGQWIKLQSSNPGYPDPSLINAAQTTFYQDITNSSLNQDYRLSSDEQLYAKFARLNNYTQADRSDAGIRFSRLNDALALTADTLFKNTGNSYTLFSGPQYRFVMNNKQYLLLSQQFYKNSKGLLLVSSGKHQSFDFINLRVNDRNEYLVSKTNVLPGGGIILPYTNKREAGLVQVMLPE